MTYNFQFQIAGLCVVLVLIITYFSKKRLITVQNKIFTVLMVDTLVQLIVDIVSVCTIFNRDKVPVLNMFLSKAYLVLMLIYVFLIDLYALSITVYDGIPEWRIKFKKVIAAVIFAGFVAASVLAVSLDLLFGGEEAVYSYGPASDTVYIFSGVSVGFVIITILVNCRHIPLRRQISLYAFGFMEGTVAIMQMLFRELLIIGFSSALLVLIMYFALENPDLEMIAELERSKKEAEESQREAMAANRAKSNFLAQMSHEIRTPINAVLGMNEMILRESHEENVLEYASNAYNAGNALLSIINDILDISKIEEGKLEITESEYELSALVSDCYLMTYERAVRKGLELSVECDGALPSKLRGDMFRIRQIVVNFLTNAIKYTDEGSVRLSFSGEEKDGVFSLRVSVKDTGIGLTEESKEKLFTRFRRFEMERNQFVEGTGLGLSICRQLTDLMGGDIEVNSVYGEGSEFICTLPQQVTDNTPVGRILPERTARRAAPSGRYAFTADGASVLVVDDIEMNLIVFSSLLKDKKMRIDTVQSGKQALEMIKDKKYDIIFMDHMMPEMSGIETFAKMKETEHINSETPVVMLTANAVSGEREKYLEEGFASYLTKPIQSSRLDELLLELLPRDKIIRQEDIKSVRELVPDGEIRHDGDLIDIKLGMSYNGGNEEIYAEVLESYVKNGAVMLSDIRELCEKEDIDGYIIKVHALKSTSLTVGARELSEAAKELETAGRAGNAELIRNRTAGLLELYGNVLAEGERYLEKHPRSASGSAEAPAGEVTEVSLEVLSEYIEMIKEACLEYDGDKVGGLCERASVYSYNGILLKPYFDSIKISAEDFECEEAAEKAEKALRELSGKG